MLKVTLLKVHEDIMREYNELNTMIPTDDGETKEQM